MSDPVANTAPAQPEVQETAAVQAADATDNPAAEAEKEPIADPEPVAAAAASAAAAAAAAHSDAAATVPEDDRPPPSPAAAADVASDTELEMQPEPETPTYAIAPGLPEVSGGPTPEGDADEGKESAAVVTEGNDDAAAATDEGGGEGEGEGEGEGSTAAAPAAAATGRPAAPDAASEPVDSETGQKRKADVDHAAEEEPPAKAQRQTEIQPQQQQLQLQLQLQQQQQHQQQQQQHQHQQQQQQHQQQMAPQQQQMMQQQGGMMQMGQQHIMGMGAQQMNMFNEQMKVMQAAQAQQGFRMPMGYPPNMGNMKFAYGYPPMQIRFPPGVATQAMQYPGFPMAGNVAQMGYQQYPRPMAPMQQQQQQHMMHQGMSMGGAAAQMTQQDMMRQQAGAGQKGQYAGGRKPRGSQDMYGPYGGHPMMQLGAMEPDGLATSKLEVQSIFFGQGTHPSEQPWTTPGALPKGQLSHYMRPTDVKYRPGPKPTLDALVEKDINIPDREVAIRPTWVKKPDVGRFSLVRTQLIGLENVLAEFKSQLADTISESAGSESMNVGEDPKNNIILAESRDVLAACTEELSRTAAKLIENQKCFKTMLEEHEPEVRSMVEATTAKAI